MICHTDDGARICVEDALWQIRLPESFEMSALERVVDID